MTENTSYQVMPALSGEEFSALKADIAESGVRVPVVKDTDGNTIDGHHRELAVRELRAEGVEVADPPTVVRDDLKTEQEKKDEAWRLNMQRRHLSREAKRDLIDHKLRETPNYSDRWLGELLGVDHKTVKSRRLSLEAGGEITQVERARGKDGKEYPRNVVGEYVDEVARRERMEAEKRTRDVRSLIRTKPYYTDGDIAARTGTSPDFVAEQRRDMKEKGQETVTMGDLAGWVSLREPELVEEQHERLAENRRRTREMRDEGLLKDTDAALAALEKLIRALQMHRLSDRPKRYISPQDAAQSYKDGYVFRGAMEVRTEGDYSQEERAQRFACALFGVRYDKTTDDPRGRPSHDQRRLIEELDTFDRLADWIRTFSNLVRYQAQQELKVIQKTEAAYLENLEEVAREEAKHRGAAVTPLAGRRKKKGK